MFCFRILKNVTISNVREYSKRFRYWLPFLVPDHYKLNTSSQSLFQKYFGNLLKIGVFDNKNSIAIARRKA